MPQVRKMLINWSASSHDKLCWVLVIFMLLRSQSRQLTSLVQDTAVYTTTSKSARHAFCPANTTTSKPLRLMGESRYHFNSSESASRRKPSACPAAHKIANRPPVL